MLNILWSTWYLLKSVGLYVPCINIPANLHTNAEEFLQQGMFLTGLQQDLDKISAWNSRTMQWDSGAFSWL